MHDHHPQAVTQLAPSRGLVLPAPAGPLANVDEARQHHDDADVALDQAQRHALNAYLKPGVAIRDLVGVCRAQQQCLDEILSAVRTLVRLGATSEQLAAVEQRLEAIAA